ncbi:MAG TPA: hypothetical protein VK585_11055 [Jiangellaceae bacterium]|nr:hypothetical protein [Jiangellaceae bacterium]
MRRPLRSLALAAGAAVAALLVLPGQAAGGGPTSVLIVSPTTGQTASLYHHDRDYELLTELLEPASALVEEAPMGVGPGTGQINVTWLVHDVSVWRVDRISLDRERGPLINTNASISSTFDPGEPGVWHRALKPAALLALLDRLVLETPYSAENAAVPAAELPVQAVTPENDRWWWAAPALAAGVALGLVGRPHATQAVRRWRDRDRGPRHQLIDV